jgi:hypothetical protein
MHYICAFFVHLSLMGKMYALFSIIGSCFDEGYTLWSFWLYTFLQPRLISAYLGPSIARVTPVFYFLNCGCAYSYVSQRLTQFWERIMS